MKKNENNIKNGNYYIGLDVGTNSVGWAVTDENYNIPKFKGNQMWGVRLFEEAKDASERRTSRSARRRLARRNQRLNLLELIFSEEISKVDANFFERLKESSLYPEDKNSRCKYSLFNDNDYNDKDYLFEYPTIYHLRSKLIHSQEKHDIRHIFLALHHIIKKRGHFLFSTDIQNETKTVDKSLDELISFLDDEYGYAPEFVNKSEYCAILGNNELNITSKKKALRKLLAEQGEDIERTYSCVVLSDMLSGSSVKLADLFLDDSLKDCEVKSISLKNDIDAVFDGLVSVLGERIELILEAKTLFDVTRLSHVLDGCEFISDAKIKLYNKNGEDLKKLKDYVKNYYPEKYNTIFKEKRDKLNNYVAYSGNKLRGRDYTCDQEAFCSYLKSQLPDMKSNEDFGDIYSEIESKTFLSRLVGSDNGVIPCQLHQAELEKILKNASVHYGFLDQKDADGLSVSQKIISIFTHKIPYYVGPLNPQSPNFWVVRTGNKIYPWNFEKEVDVKQSAEQFMIKLIGKCTYTGESVIPKDSLLYSEFMLRNEINLLRVNGKEIPRNVMDKLYDDLFVSSCKKVTKKTIKLYLLSNGLITENDEISGIDDTIKSKLKSYHDFKLMMSKGLSSQDVEGIIRRILIFGEDKKMLRDWLKENHPSLTESDVSYVCRLKYKDWGRFSEQFLTEIYHEDANKNVFCIMDMLRNANVNLMQLLSDEYDFAKDAEKVRLENVGGDSSLDDRIDKMYIAPAVKRSVRQTLKIVDEIVDIQKCAPKKIFIEVARGSQKELKGIRTSSRKTKLIELYKACREESNTLFEKLNNEEENRLRSDKLYLYYAQFGKCMYSGEAIDINSLGSENSGYDIDHIFPRSRVKDDSIDNRVLVKSVLNREKTNKYPIDESTRHNMYPFWKSLKEKGFISVKKFDRLVRSTPLTDKELSEFVARQLVETQQSAKAIATLMKEYYPNTTLVYSKAINVSDFRHKFGFVKCRDINNLHHAKDAYLNVVVGNVYNTKFTEKFFMNIRSEEYSLNKIFEFDTPGAWKKDGTTIATVRNYMNKNNIKVTRMPREAKGQLFDLNILKAGKGQLAAKSGKDIDKYGGYNNLSGAYMILVEHIQKGKRIRSIETVLQCDKTVYENNPQKYCVEILGLEAPVIIVPKIRFDTLVELNGSKVYFSGRTGDYYLCKHAYELALNAENEQYIKQIQKYVERCIARKKELPISTFDGITSEQNEELYSWFIQKLSSNVYIKFFKLVVADLVDNENTFKNMNIYSQCRLLLEILKAFKCDRQNPNFQDLCGKKTVGIIKFHKNISKYTSAYMINQSPTGLYEYKIDLLK